MTNATGGFPPSPAHQDQPSTPQVAKEEAADVARTAADKAGDVAGTVGEQATRVASETAQQARNLFEESKGQLVEQAREGQRKAAGGLHALADQLHSMSEKSDGTGMVPEVARQASERAHTVASWLEEREPGDLVEEVRRFARRRPGMFLAGAALAGVVAGRLTRGVIAERKESSAPADPQPPQPQQPPAQAQAVNPAYDLPVPDQPMATPGYSMPPAPSAPGTGPSGHQAGPVTR